ncbi:MAG: Fic family protein [Candidatus Omnitrophica bacterium]|nr:Fic family protein [Candidatus Omnitrophota bacterium]
MNDYLEKQKIVAKYSLGKWREIEEERRRKASSLELLDKKGKPFWFVLSSHLVELISEIERNRGFLASLKLPKRFLDRLSSESEKKEAYYSSHIEGAVTSLEAALLYLNKPSRSDYGDESLQMIINNRDALEYVREQSGNPFSHKIICELHKILVRNTHKERPITVGEYRKGPIYVVDGQGQVVYEGPPASQVTAMMDSYVGWMNGESNIHALIQAALVHLYFVHVHPFDDGNGRSARALSNLYLMKQEYQFINFLSPSDYFDHHRSEYYRAIQNFEAHECDATFFIIYYLTALTEQLKNVQTEIGKETKVRNIHDLLSQQDQAKLDKKQMKALQWMLEHPEAMTTKKYCKLGQCSDETARKDFNRLLEAGLIEKIGHGRTTGYVLKT